MMKTLLVSLSLILILNYSVYSQREKSFSLVGSYQVYNLQAISIGAQHQIDAIWPKVKFKSSIQSILRGIWFISNSNSTATFGLGNTIYWSNKYLGIGLNSRLLFHDKSNRADFGPVLKIGFKYLWIEYTLNVIELNNIFIRDNMRSTFDSRAFDHNLNLTLVIPIIKSKK